MIRHSQPEPKQCFTSAPLLRQTAARHGAEIKVVDGYYAAVVCRPSGEAVIWRAVVPAAERVA